MLISAVVPLLGCLSLGTGDPPINLERTRELRGVIRIKAVTTARGPALSLAANGETIVVRQCRIVARPGMRPLVVKAVREGCRIETSEVVAEFSERIFTGWAVPQLE
jgi:hypothetical protein